ncbi:hypothetical protein GCM10027447_32880 [Glycomyces halotolerans]
MLDAVTKASIPRQHPQATMPTPTRLPSSSKSKQPKATKIINDHNAIAVGETLELRLQKRSEHAALDTWLKADSLRNLATWAGGKGRVLKWAYDGRLYTPTGLFKKIWREATGSESQQVRGTLYWHIRGRGSLAEIAAALLSASAATP